MDRPIMPKSECGVRKDYIYFQLLFEITKIIRSNGYDDDECFDKIEEIVCLFENNNISAGNRHDFG